ncbi:MAG: ChaN family lipoprotein [Myxococcota bacterium]
MASSAINEFDPRVGRASNRRELTALHREIYRRNQLRIAEAVAEYTPAFRRYERTYRRRVQRYHRRAEVAELVRRLDDAHVVYVGDYHTLAQSQRGFLRLLHRVPSGRPITIALEFVRARHQTHIDAFLRDEIDEAAFLQAIGYRAEIGVGEWESFRRIFDFAREHECRVVGLDTLGRGPRSKLVNRDHSAARVIERELRARPEHLIMTLIGELHVAPEHLPQRVHERLQRHGLAHEPLVIYQNCHEIYWQLAARGIEHEVDLVRVARGEYYLPNTLPIVAQQSFLNGIHVDDDSQLEAPESNFIEFARVIADFLELDLGDSLHDVEVTSVVDLSFLQRLQRRGDFSSEEMRHIRRQILQSESYFIPRTNMVYLGNLSVNHAAEEAAHFVRAVCSGSAEPRLLVDAFYARCLEEAAGFLGSKLLNHKRRAPNTKSLERQSKSSRYPSETRKIARLVLKHLRMETGRKIRGGAALYECDADTFNGVTHLLGYTLGEKIYYSLVDSVLDKADVRDLFTDHYEDEGVALTTYLYYVQKTRSARIPSHP